MIPLENLGPIRAQKNKKEGWSHSVKLTEVHTAKAWGMTPSKFRSLPWIDQAEMIAHEIVTDEMGTFEEARAKSKSTAKGITIGLEGV